MKLKTGRRPYKTKQGNPCRICSDTTKYEVNGKCVPCQQERMRHYNPVKSDLEKLEIKMKGVKYD